MTKEICNYCGNKEKTIRDWIKHINIEQPKKIHYFCCKEHKLKWMYRIQKNNDTSEM